MSNDKPVSVSEFVASDGPYLSKEQVEPMGAVRGVIDRVTKENVPKSGTSSTEGKFVVWFKGWKKGLVVGARCNRKFLAKIMGGTKTSEWEGRAIWIYVDPSAAFGGQRVGGIRFAWGDQHSGQCAPPLPTPTSGDALMSRSPAGTTDPGDNGVDPDREATLDRLAAEEAARAEEG